MHTTLNIAITITFYEFNIWSKKFIINPTIKYLRRISIFLCSLNPSLDFEEKLEYDDKTFAPLKTPPGFLKLPHQTNTMLK